MKHLKKQDIKIYSLIKQEENRQKNTLMMIPSENMASSAVEEAVGSSLENKYAEGYPHKRYYQGQANVDEIEIEAIERAKSLFKVVHANVQPYSGSPANFEAYNAILNPGDKIMGLSLSFGGHLTHGSTASATSKYFKSIQYELGADGYIDYKDLMRIAKKEKPRVIVAGTTAYPRILEWKKFYEIAEAVGAYLLCDISHIAGLIVGGAYPSPVNYSHIITTTTHKTLRGPRGAMILVTKKGIQKDPDLAKKVDKSVFPQLQGGPHINTIAGIAVALKEASKPSFKKYAKQIIKNAKALAKELTKRKFDLISGGTDSHLLLIDLRNKNIIGNTLAEGLESIGIVTNYNSVPFDTNPPFYPSGIRLGTPGITSRGMTDKDMIVIASCMSDLSDALANTKISLNLSSEDEKKRAERKKIIDKTKIIPALKKKILLLCKKYPVKKSY
ncbi:MAG: serine hydroxymethyltransferase [Patescibacteria group bacterium]